jgi:hypothetical protein
MSDQVNITGSLDFARNDKSFCKFRPHRRVIRRIFSSTHFAVDPGGAAFFRQRFACQNSVYAQAAIFLEGAHLIIPPAEKFSFLVMDSKRVV